MQTTSQTESKTFILPTIEQSSDHKLFFLFSRSQIVEVLHDVPVHPIPFCDEFIRGGAAYNHKMLPVISPEKLLGLKDEKTTGRYRQLIVVRSSIIDPQSGGNLQLVIATDDKLVQAKHLTDTLIGEMKVTTAPQTIPNQSLIMATFQQDDSFFIVLDLNKLARGQH